MSRDTEAAHGVAVAGGDEVERSGKTASDVNDSLSTGKRAYDHRSSNMGISPLRRLNECFRLMSQEGGNPQKVEKRSWKRVANVKTPQPKSPAKCFEVTTLLLPPHPDVDQHDTGTYTMGSNGGMCVWAEGVGRNSCRWVGG